MTGASAHREPRDGRVTILGTSPSLVRALRQTGQFARSRMPILLVGETGTGKELFARRVHELSGRTGSLVDVDCGALPADLTEALLFGRRRGAYTGAHESAHGLVEEAAGGTLFLDELSNLPLVGQRKLLRVLESGEIRRIGETAKRRVDFRLVSAVQPDFQHQLREGSFRLDLFQRIAGVVVNLPSLAERSNDIGILAAHFSASLGVAITDEVSTTLRDRAWPGNVRELRSTIERAACLCNGKIITARDLAEAMCVGPSIILPTRPNVREESHPAIARHELLEACRAYGGDARRIADALGIGRATLFRRLRAAGLSLRDLG